MGGTLSSVASIINLAVADDVTDDALAYFLTADIFILLCIILYLILPRLAYSRWVAALEEILNKSVHLLHTCTEFSNVSFKLASAHEFKPFKFLVKVFQHEPIILHMHFFFAAVWFLSVGMLVRLKLITHMNKVNEELIMVMFSWKDQ